MQVNVFNYVSPSEIDKLFSDLKKAQAGLHKAINLKTIAKQQIAMADAALSNDPDFKWGRNDTAREAQSRLNASGNWKDVDKAERDIKMEQSTIELIRLDIERIKLLRDLFGTGNYDIDVKDVSPS